MVIGLSGSSWFGTIATCCAPSIASATTPSFFPSVRALSVAVQSQSGLELKKVNPPPPHNTRTCMQVLKIRRLLEQGGSNVEPSFEKLKHQKNCKVSLVVVI